MAGAVKSLAVLAILGAVVQAVALPGNRGVADTDLNIPHPPKVDENSDPERFEGFNRFIAQLKRFTDFKQSPCDNFYEYVCNSIPKGTEPFSEVNDQNLDDLVSALKKPQNTTFGKKAKTLFDNCANRFADPESFHRNGEALREIYQHLAETLELPFPALGLHSEGLNAKNPGHLVGKLASFFNVHTFLTYDIKFGELHVSGPTLQYPAAYFVEKWAEVKDSYREATVYLAKQLAEILNQAVDEEQLIKDVEEVLQFERTLAMLASRKEQTQKSSFAAARGVNGLVDFELYLQQIFSMGEETAYASLQQEGVELHVAPSVELVNSFLSTVDKRVLFNYLSFRLMKSFRDYFPKFEVKPLADEWVEDAYLLEQDGFVPPLPQKNPHPTAGSSTAAERSCARSITWQVNHATDRLFLDQVYPTLESRHKNTHDVSVLVSKVLNGFQYQLTQLDWMEDKSKESAYEKVREVIRNILYDPWIVNDTLLDEKYKLLDVSETNFFLLSLNTMAFKQRERLATLNGDGRHYDFGQSILTVNAWYYPGRNSFYLPLGIARPPFYDYNYPIAIRYGGIGYVVGHELTHGFDTNGVKYDSQGKYNPWMDKNSTAAFQKMADCVINQYNGLHKSGRTTVTEDIADNGGLRASFNAFVTNRNLYGAEGRLPVEPYSEFTDEQLFFTAMARFWCSPNPTRYAGVHSPAKYRVVGSMQNFPAMGAAFNCKANSYYTPAKHCNVWASEVKIVSP